MRRPGENWRPHRDRGRHCAGTPAGTRAQAAECLVGTWKTVGEIRASPSGPAVKVHATDAYEWLPGEVFVVHRWNAHMPDREITGIEIIGHDTPRGTYSMLSFDSRATPASCRRASRVTHGHLREHPCASRVDFATAATPSRAYGNNGQATARTGYRGSISNSRNPFENGPATTVQAHLSGPPSGHQPSTLSGAACRYSACRRRATIARYASSTSVVESPIASATTAGSSWRSNPRRQRSRYSCERMK
jgi:hypothetical protein